MYLESSVGATEGGNGVNLVSGNLYIVPGGIEKNASTLGHACKQAARNMKFNTKGWHPFTIEIVIDTASRLNVTNVASFVIWKLHRICCKNNLNQHYYISDDNWFYDFQRLSVNVKLFDYF